MSENDWIDEVLRRIRVARVTLKSPEFCEVLERRLRPLMEAGQQMHDTYIGCDDLGIMSPSTLERYRAARQKAMEP